MNQPQAYRHSTAEEIRGLCRRGEWTTPTAGMAEGYAQANLVVLQQGWADEFHEFCQKNPRPCPLLDVTQAGQTCPPLAAKNCDIRTDVPCYRLWKAGQLAEEPTDLHSAWQDDFVSFLIGCSFTFESALMQAGIPVRHIDLGLNVPMFRTNIACKAAGRFSGPMVVSMRPLAEDQIDLATEMTASYPDVHGAPIHVGDPSTIGIQDISKPDFGDSVPIHDNEYPVFWACGVTPQLAIANACPPIAITHSPGCMLVTDLRDDDLKR